MVIIDSAQSAQKLEEAAFLSARLRAGYLRRLKENLMDSEKKDLLTAEADGMIEGRNAVIEALRAGETIDKIYIARGETDKTLGHIASKARAAGVVVVEADRRKLDGMSRTHAHQGVIALAAVREGADGF